MRDYRLILELGSDTEEEPPYKIHVDIKADSRHGASAFADKAYPSKDGWHLVDVIDIMTNAELEKKFGVKQHDL